MLSSSSSSPSSQISEKWESISSSAFPSSHADPNPPPLPPSQSSPYPSNATYPRPRYPSAAGCRMKPKKPSTRYLYNTPNIPPRRKIYNSPLSDEENSDSPLLKKPKQKTRSSSVSDEAAWFSSEETSGHFSTDSNYSSALSDPVTETPIVKNTIKKKRAGNRVMRVKYYGNSKVAPVGKKVTYNTPGTEFPDKEKTKKSLAVMKKSEDPYGDFRRSMMEMIVEREMFETNDLEQLLQCFLSLNSRHHYGVIIEAFSDIWEILFCKSTVM